MWMLACHYSSFNAVMYESETFPLASRYCKVGILFHGSISGLRRRQPGQQRRMIITPLFPQQCDNTLRGLEEARMNPFISKIRGGGEGKSRNNGADAIKA